MPKRLLLLVLALAFIAAAQRRVDPRNTYYRVIAAVPVVGSGTPADPERPRYAPWPAPEMQTGIIAFYSEPSDDGKLAIAEFVAGTRGAFQMLLSDATVTSFEKGRKTNSEIAAGLKPLRKDFDPETFGMTMPSGPIVTTKPDQSGYQYYFTDTFSSLDNGKWGATGNLTPTGTGLAAPDANGGSAISKLPIPDGSSEAEVRMQVTLAASGGSYTEFLQGTSDARAGGPGGGSYLAFEMQNPTIAAGVCTANFAILQSKAGKVSLLSEFAHSCRNGMVMRMAVHRGVLLVWPDQDTPLEFQINAPVTGAGQPGIGARSTPPGNSIAQVQIGAANRVPPGAVDERSIGVSAFRKHVDLQWKPVPNPANGLAGYWIYRDGSYLARTSGTTFSDEAVSPGSRHLYTIYAVDQHFNFSPGAQANVAVPAAMKNSLGPPPAPSPLKK